MAKFHKFASAESQGARQAKSIMKELQGKEIKSIGTVRNYEQALKQFCTHLAAEGQHIRDIGEKEAQNYLENRAAEVGQKTLDLDRQAIQKALKTTGAIKENLAVIKSEKEQKLESRAYTKDQVNIIAGQQSEKNALATQVAYSAGLRAHELLTLQKAEQKPADPRPANEEKFNGRDGQIYTVQGKGGLIREVLIPNQLAEKLEERRLENPQTVTDRGVHYKQHYNLGGGKNWSASVTRVAQNNLGWSAGAHGLRHSYAQERMHELQKTGLSYERALETTSQEMGHFRPDITEVYLR